MASQYNRNRDPRTKEELLDRMLSFDFDGDIRHLGKENASIHRIARNKIELRFPDSDRTYELTVRLPRGEQKAARREEPVEAPEKPTPRASARKRAQPRASN